MSQLPKTVIIGSGNVGTRLGIAFMENGIPILQVYSRTRSKAGKLGKMLHCPFTTKLHRINNNGTFYLICVSDDAITEVAEQIKYLDGPEKVFALTSGSTSIKVLKTYFHKRECSLYRICTRREA